MELRTTLPIATTFLVVLVLIICLRYRLYSSSYKEWLKRLRRPSTQDGPEDNEPIDEEMFKPPPEYDTAVNMPKPCSRCRRDCETRDTRVQCSCSPPEQQSGSAETDTDTRKTDTETEAESHTVPQSVSHRCADSCIVTFHSVPDERNMSEFANGPFVILEHVQRMVQDPSIPSNYLPTYQEYTKEFPEENNHV